jgi:hypothetical protein
MKGKTWEKQKSHIFRRLARGWKKSIIVYKVISLHPLVLVTSKDDKVVRVYATKAHVYSINSQNWHNMGDV